MRVRIFYPNKNNKIEFTKQQLEKLLDEVYEEGRAKGWNEGYATGKPYTITYPYTPYWYTTTTTPFVTCNSDSLTTSTTTITNTEPTSGYVNVNLNQVNSLNNALTIGDE